MNEFELPPRSPENVVADSGGALNILFDTPISDFSAYFTYAQALTLEAFNSADVLLGSASSAFLNNFALSGDAGSSPNELIGIASVGSISRILITGSASVHSYSTT